MSTGTPLEWARDSAPASGLQSWSWALAIAMALVACAVVLWLRKRGGAPLWTKPGNSPVRRLGGTRLNQKVTLEVVEFGGQRILLSVSETGAQEIARNPVDAGSTGSSS
ncbi:flagellar biosynthetic protein FliO [Achromobacter marplatensis]|jgi:hypothetical protein|uniref:flagellar biosynthetic protein FliO n=1 Tax=Achromobacter marplatensis TaxID=470868 RepID=UPI0028E7C85E|nr:flagellar biosynthetic protein FliO [Achromobacter marplatensis]